MSRHENLILYMGDDTEVHLPTRWAICPDCQGEGARACGGQAFTASEWNEACHDDPDFAEEYMNGTYDRTCEDCGGSGKIKMVDEDLLSQEQRDAWEKQCQEDYDMAAERAAEMRMGC